MRRFVRRALEHRSRPERGPFEIGDVDYYWRLYPKEGKGRWHGPATVSGSYQETAIKMISQDLVQARRAERGAQKFIDITAEGVRDENEPPPTLSGVKRSADEAGLGHVRETSNAEEMDELINQAVHMHQDGEDMLSQQTQAPSRRIIQRLKAENRAIPCQEDLQNQPGLGMTMPLQR